MEYEPYDPGSSLLSIENNQRYNLSLAATVVLTSPILPTTSLGAASPTSAGTSFKARHASTSSALEYISIFSLSFAAKLTPSLNNVWPSRMSLQRFRKP